MRCNKWGDNVVSGDFLSGVPIRPPVRTGGLTGTVHRSTSGNRQSFAEVLSQAADTAKLKFSAHAMARIEQRGMQLTPHDVETMGRVVNQMADKGTKAAYLSYGTDGFVVNVPNRTVITAMSHDTEKVVTNIDGVAIIPRLDR